MKSCVFAGTFDPISKGHEYVVNKCLKAFDKVVIAVGVNVDKKPMFSLEQRIEMIKAVFEGNDKVEVKSFDGMLVDFMKENDLEFTVRGIRDVKDYEYENKMAQYNSDLYPEVTTIFYPTPASLGYVSSSGIRNIIELKGDYVPFVPEKALWLIKKFIDKK